MSLDTRADLAVEIAKESIQRAVEGLAEVVVERCSGSDEFNETYQRKYREALYKLIEIRDDIG